MGGFVRAVNDSHGDALPDASTAGVVLRVYGYGHVVLALRSRVGAGAGIGFIIVESFG